MLMIIAFSFLINNSFYAQKNSVAIDTKSNDLEWGGCPEFMPEGCNITVLNGDPAVGNADILFKVPGSSDIPMHWHTSAERMILISGEMEVTYEGEDPQILKAGYYAYGPAKKPHTAKCKGSEPCVLFIAFEEPVDAVAGKGK